MYSDLIKPISGENEVVFAKRKAYYYRIVVPRFEYGEKCIHLKLDHRQLVSENDRKAINALWAKYLSPNQRAALIDDRYYEVYNSVLREGERLCDYMPDTFYCAFIDEYFTNPQHSVPSDDKCLYDLFFHDINHPKTVFKKMYGLYLDEKYDEITIDEAIALAREQGEVILKASRFSSGGQGIFFWDPDRDNDSKLRDYLVSCDDVVCQEVLKQHSELSRLNPTSVNTVRIMTLLFRGKVHVLSSVVRMGVDGSRVDNASLGGIVCGIKSDGRLKNVAYDTSANKYLQHPQGTTFESVTIPNYHECIEMVTSLAKRFGSLIRLISWDIAIDETGHPSLIEMNFAGQLDFHQLCNGPIFGNMTQDVLDAVFNNSYTLKSILKSYQ